MTLERRKLRRSIPMLNDLDNYLYADVKRVFVFGREGDCVFLITKNDHVYGYGKNNSGCLGLGINEPVPEPEMVRALNGRKIVEFAAGRNHVLALNKNGQVFACGSNEYGQLALESSTNTPMIIQSLLNERIIGIACGAFHSLVLTHRGLIAGFGYNFWGQLGIGNNKNQFQPVFILSLFNENILEIASGQHHSVALSKKGDLFTWGHNAFGQLGIGEEINFKNIPSKAINGKEFQIKQVTCGQNHVLAVSAEGKLLGFGSNYYGQLGTGSRQNESSPVQICSEEKIKEILSSPFSNTSLARTKKKRNSLVFGKCGDHWLLTPINTELSDEIDINNNNNNTNNNNNNVPDKIKSMHSRRNSRISCHEVFANINQSTAHTTKVVKHNKKTNLFWQMIYLIKSKFNQSKRNFHSNLSNNQSKV